MQWPARLENLVGTTIGAHALRNVLVLSAAAAFLSFLGPFGTRSELGPVERVVYWTVAIAAGRIGAEVFAVAVKPVLLRKGFGKRAEAVGVGFITLGALLAVLVLEALFREPVPSGYWLGLVVSVFVVSLAVWGVASLAREALPSGSVPDPAFARFQAGWPAHLRAAALLALAAEDHYVRLYTDRGEALVAGRFGEALRAVERLAGTQVHRSWWVSDGAVQGLVRQGGRWTIKGPGLDIPVSRRFRPHVRAMGWDRRRP